MGDRVKALLTNPSGADGYYEGVLERYSKSKGKYIIKFDGNDYDMPDWLLREESLGFDPDEITVIHEPVKLGDPVFPSQRSETVDPDGAAVTNPKLPLHDTEPPAEIPIMGLPLNGGGSSGGEDAGPSSGKGGIRGGKSGSGENSPPAGKN